MKYNKDAPMTPAAWLLAFFYVLGIVIYSIVCFWAIVLLFKWFIMFWYPNYMP
jgi:hypothetical protein